MAATIELNEWNGTLGTQAATPKSGGIVRFKSADDSVVDENDKLVRPNAGVYRSYEKYLRLYIDDLVDSANISNLEVFTSGTPNTGISIWAKAVDAFATPKVGGYGIAGAMAAPKQNLFTYTSAEPLSLGEGPYDANVDDGDIEDAGIGKYLVLQMEVLPSVETGDTDSYELILRYDEE